MFPQMQSNEPLNPAPDLSDPKVLAALLRDDAQGLKTQANASGLRASALGGHPQPEFFYRAVAAHLEAAAALIDPAPAPAGPGGGPAVPHRTAVATSPEALSSLPGAWNPGDAAPDAKKKPK